MLPKLYFPENKLEFIPAILEFLFFVILALLVIKLLKWISKRELEKWNASPIHQTINNEEKEDPQTESK